MSKDIKETKEYRLAVKIANWLFTFSDSEGKAVALVLRKEEPEVGVLFWKEDSVVDQLVCEFDREGIFDDKEDGLKLISEGIEIDF